MQKFQKLSKSQEFAFSQAIASVSLETKTLTNELIRLLKQAIIEKKTPNELLDLIDASR